MLDDVEALRTVEPRSMLLCALTAVALAGLAACGGEGPGNGSAGDGDSVPGAQEGGSTSPVAREAMMEFQRVQKQLRSVQQQALEDSSLKRRMQGLQSLIDSTVRAMSDRAGRQMGRLDSLRGRIEVARSESDSARLRSLVREARKLQRSLQKVRSKAMRHEDVAPVLEEFRTAVREKMRQIEPGTDSLMERADSLRRRMQRRRQGGNGGVGTEPDTAGG